GEHPVRRRGGAAGSSRAPPGAAPRPWSGERAALWTGRPVPAGDRRPQRLLPAARPTRGLQPAARPGGSHREGTGELDLRRGSGGGDVLHRNRRRAARPRAEPAMTAPLNPVPFLSPDELQRDTDGREVDPTRGMLEGEGAAQSVRRPEPHPGKLAL